MSGTDPKADALVILAEFVVPDAVRAEFLIECAADGQGSVSTEPGCQLFDVLAPQDGSGRVTLLEIYDNDAAFDAHRQTTHYARFDAAVKRLGLAAPAVHRLSRLHRGVA